MSQGLKKTIIFALILGILLQSFPAPAQASFSLTKFFQNLFRKINLPEEIKLTDRGDVALGGLTLFRCIDKDSEGKCINPFSTIHLGSDQTPVSDSNGRLMVPQARIPDDCQLKIPQPSTPGEEELSRKESQSLFEACTIFRSIQRNAINQVFVAKKLFNNTDPLSNCLFLRNCKSSCKLRLGEISYTISLFDVALMITGPLGFANTIRKIANIAMQVKKVLDVVTLFKDIIVDGFNALKDILKTAGYLSSFFYAFSTVLEVGPAGFKSLFGSFSNNLLLFSQAKSEIATHIGKSQDEADTLINILRQEKGLSFLFKDNEDSQKKREKLKELINGLTVKIEDIESLMSRLKQTTKAVKDLKEPAGEVSCEEEPTEPCRVISSLPQGCYGEKGKTGDNGIRDDRVIKCPAATYEIQVGQGPEDIPGNNNGVFPSNCLTEGNKITCPATSCSLDYSRLFGVQEVNCPTISKNPVQISCPTKCSVSCISPKNNWYSYFQTIGQGIDTWTDVINIYKSCLNTCPDLRLCASNCFLYLTNPSAVDTIDVLKDFQGKLSQEAKKIPSFTDENNQEHTYFWNEQTSTITTWSLEEAKKWGEENCQYNHRLRYFLWKNKIKNIEGVDFGEAKENFEVLLSEMAQSQNQLTPQQASTFLNNFLSTPQINFRLDRVNNLLEDLKNDLKSENNPKKEMINNIGEIENKIKKLELIFGNLNQDLTRKITTTTSEYVKRVAEAKKGCQTILNIVEEIDALYQKVKDVNPSNEGLKQTESVVLGTVKDIASNFLDQLGLFEQDLGQTIENLIIPLVLIEDVEKIKEMLDDLAEQVGQIQPTIDIERGESVDDLIKNIGQDPLPQLEKYFDKADKDVNDIVSLINNDFNNRLNKMSDSPNKENNKRKIADLKDYVETIGQEISGGKGTENACQAVSFLSKTPPPEIEQACQGLKDNSLLDDQDLQDKCDFRSQIGVFLTNANLTIEDFDQKIKSGEIPPGTLNDFWKDEACGEAPPPIISGGDLGMQPNPDFQEWSNCATLPISPEMIDNLSQKELKEKCLTLSEQKSLTLGCDNYETIKNALKNKCPGGISQCSVLRDSFEALKQHCDSWNNSIPNLTIDQDPAKEDFQNSQLEQAQKICSSQLSDLRTPLEEVMKVFAVLLGIKSGTLAYKGVKTSIEDVKKIIASVKKFKKAIKELPEKLKERNDYPSGGSGFSIEAVRCISKPALGYNGISGPRGGPVCPAIDQLFSTIQSEFSLMRQNLNKLYMLTKEKKWWGAKIGSLKIGLLKTYPDYNGGKGVYFDKVSHLYERAQGIKERSQNLWGIAVAINFASQNCTCGQSYCELPLCFSGAPLTLEPLSNPYCYIVYVLRHPFLKQVKTLENYLK